MIYKWEIPNIWPNKRIGMIIKGTGTDRFEFRKCELLSEDNTICPNIVFECREKFLFDVLPNSGLLLIVSKRVLDIMNNFCEGDFQQFKANIFVGEKEIEGYYLLNILNKIEILDKEKSIFTTILDTDAILNLKKAVYKYEDLLGRHIVRNADCLSHILVTEKLKEIFEKEKIKGVEFGLE
ncbi:imm11 family protein [Clostridium estertheticum]|uniref:Immunity MXAN-0049 protein domain-containing protein n=1 Tax=Clostridium estertheticum TaxID=238834 RepID=A0A5N7IMV9_9CLOT|nr:DUF1629 domain-containing protein [Clostridium estertheticum]MCB2343288.1 hypothetical protein [Clostridium estertheticum]MPQ31649.1 hypothetical protein [Clostridium estertheticum]MPQ62313.1 hypothetical protein [Clostridium estertheticum]